MVMRLQRYLVLLVVVGGGFTFLLVSPSTNSVCWVRLVWDGAPLVLHHYKKTTGELRKHYKDAWGITNLSSATGNGYLGKAPPMKQQYDWNQCKDERASRLLGKYHQVVKTLAVEARGGAGAKVCLPEGRVAGPLCRPYFAVVDVAMKGERLEYLFEFIEHHVAVGFGHIYLGLNHEGETYDQYAGALQPYVDAGVLTVTACDNQTAAHKRHTAVHANKTFWMARVDIDEFIVPSPPADSVVQVLLPLTGRYGDVPMQLKMARYDFGDSGLLEHPAGSSIVAAYTWRGGLARSTKAIFQTDGLLLPKNITDIQGNPHEVLSAVAGLNCQDSHWLFGFVGWAFVCFPQKFKVYWPPPVPAAMRKAVSPRVPFAASAWADATSRGSWTTLW